MKVSTVDNLLKSQTSTASPAEPGGLLLVASQYEQLESIVDDVIRDTMYTLLLGLDGAARIGKDQRHFTIACEDGQPIENLEDEAWKRFQGNR